MRRHRLLAACAGIASLLLAPGNSGAETLTEALSDAYSNNPQILAERALLRATDDGWAATMRREQKGGQALDRADLYSAGTLVTAPHGHGTGQAVGYGTAWPGPVSVR